MEGDGSYAGGPGTIAVLDAPSNLGLRPPRPGAEPGCKGLARALRARGVVEKLGAEDAGGVAPPRYSPVWDGETARNAASIARYSRELADRVGSLLDEGRFPLVLGGDCSILLGNMLALRRRRGRFGLTFLDGHLDFRHPGNSGAMGAAAGEDLALVTGRGSEELTDLDGLKPLVREEDVVALGEREGGSEADDARGAGIAVLDLASIRELGAPEAARRVVARFEGSELDGFWIHLDADVLDDEVMPAVDSPQPNGLGRAELVAMLRILLASELKVGMEVTVFDPELDPGGGIAAAFIHDLVAALSTRHTRRWRSR